MNLYPDGVSVRREEKGNRRWYEVEGDARVEHLHLRNVSTICNVVDKPGLRYWMVNQAFSRVEKVLADPMSQVLSPEQIIENAREMPTEGEVLADQGTAIHEALEGITSSRGAPVKYRAHCDSLLSYLDEQGFTVEATEAMLYHPTLYYGGTADLVVSSESGTLEILDYKTGKIYDEHALQLAGYAKALEATSMRKVVGARALQINPETGDITEHKVRDLEQAFEAFTGAVHLDKWLQDKEKWL